MKVDYKSKQEALQEFVEKYYAQCSEECVNVDLDLLNDFNSELYLNAKNNCVRFIEIFKKLTNKQILLTNNTNFKVNSVREIDAESIGKLVQVKGIVVKCTDVKPFMSLCCYACDICGEKTLQEVKSTAFTPLNLCNSDQCTKNNSKGKLFMNTKDCVFIKQQYIKLQETTDQVPVGHIPRSMNIILEHHLCRTVTPGDVITVSGVFLPSPFTGYKARSTLLADTFILAQEIQNLKKNYKDLVVTEEIEERLNQLKADPDLYNKLAQSIAPEIYGHDDIKKSLLLLLVGGATKMVGDGMKIRGDINVCLMGDPGVAKSQLLKYISKVAPRGVYTTGKGSSGVGLTAAVTKDAVTGEMVLEGGALVLADNGICCIDEFDKMDESDRTAIHEVMEQQTISISKAGITTTLNARTCILAAANPHYGRYNVKRSPTENINLPAALLSRFDLLFLILDNPSLDNDLHLGHHVTHVHIHMKHPDLGFTPVDPHLLRHYIAQARTKRPTVPPQVSRHIINEYVSLRKMESDGTTPSFTYTTPRSLLGIVRMAQALARLRFADIVEIDDVHEALRLMQASKKSLERNDKRTEQPVARIFSIIRSFLGKDVVEVDMAEIKGRVMAQGFVEKDLEECLKLYAGMNIWQYNDDVLTFVN